MKPFYEIVYGAFGSGKSTYAGTLISIPETFKIGIGSAYSETLLLAFGAIKKHEEENKKIGVKYQRVTLETIAQEIRKVPLPTLWIDDWTTLIAYSLFMPEKRIHDKIDNIFDSIIQNANISRCLFVSTDLQTYLPFRLYKKTAIWNKRLFATANKITKIEYGIPIRIK